MRLSKTALNQLTMLKDGKPRHYTARNTCLIGLATKRLVTREYLASERPTVEVRITEAGQQRVRDLGR